MASVHVLTVPWDSGHRGRRMGAGPLRLLEAGLLEALRDDGHRVEHVEVEHDGGLPAELAATFELARSLSSGVASAVAGHAFPLIVSGGCGSAAGTVAGLGPEDVGVVWFDSHGDLNTPETTASGFVDGTAASTLLGRCWATLAASIPGFRPVPPDRVVFVGVRDLDPAEEDWLDGSPSRRVGVAAVREEGAAGALRPALEALVSAGARRVYVHVDLDVLDPAAARVNGYQAPGGLTLPELVDAVATIGRALDVAAGSVTSLDPSADPAGLGVDAGLEVARALADAGART